MRETEKSPAKPSEPAQPNLSDLTFSFTTADVDSSTSSATVPQNQGRSHTTNSSTQSTRTTSTGGRSKNDTVLNTSARSTTTTASSPKPGWFSRLWRSQNRELKLLEQKFMRIYPEGEIKATKTSLSFKADRNSADSPSFSTTRYRGAFAKWGIRAATTALLSVPIAFYTGALAVSTPPLGLLGFAAVCGVGYFFTTKPTHEYKLSDRAIKNCTGSKADVWEHTTADVLAAWRVTTSASSWSGQFSLNPLVWGEVGNDLNTEVLKPLHVALDLVAECRRNEKESLADFGTQNNHDNSISMASRNWGEYESAFKRKYETQQYLFRGLGLLTGGYGALTFFPSF